MATFNYTCKCGKLHETDDVWAIAHWDILLQHTCDACGCLNTIKSGKILESEEPDKKDLDK